MGRGLAILIAILVIAGAVWFLVPGLRGPGTSGTTTDQATEDSAMEDMALPGAAEEDASATDEMAAEGASTDEEAPLVDRALLFGNPDRIQGRLSPDGTMISFLAPFHDVLNIWVAPVGDIEAARVISNDQSRGIRQHFWMADGRFIVYLQDTGGNENWHIHAVNVETGEDRDLTPVPEGARATIMAASFRQPDSLVIGTNERDPSIFDPFMLNVVTGEMTQIEENPGFVGYDIDEDLSLRLATQQTASGGFETLKRVGDNWEPLWEVPQEDSLTSSTLFFNEEGTGIYILSSVGRDTAALYLLDVDSGDQTLIAENDDADITGVLSNPVTNEILAVNYEYTRSEWQATSEEVSDDFALLGENLEGDASIVAQSQDNRYWLVAENAAQKPTHYYLLDRYSGELTDQFSSRPELDAAPLQPMQSLVLQSRDGLNLVSYLTLPPGSDADGDGIPEEPQPMVLYVHGGPWARDSYGYNTTHQWLANRGYAVLSVNYRGSSGFGKNFIAAATDEFAGAMHDDLIDAVNWAIENGIAQSDQVAIMGGSYGGYATLVGLTFTPETFACGVDIVGPSNLVTLINSFPAYWGPFLEATWYSRVGDPRTEEGRAALMAASPITRAGDIVRPLLIGQGGNDPRVTKQESDQIVAAMQEHNQPVTYVLYPDEGHGFARPENRDSFYGISEAFLSGCLGGRYQPFGTSFEGSSTEILAGIDNVPGLADAMQGFEPTVRQ